MSLIAADRNTRIIELVGPPGIGKSTLYKALCKDWRSGCNWIYQEKLLSNQPTINSPKKWLQYQVKKMLATHNGHSIPVEYGMRFTEKNNKTANYLWNYLNENMVCGDDMIGQKFRAAYFLFKDYSRYQAIWEKESNMPCIIDEGLLEKSFFVLDNRNKMNEKMETYLDIVPLPNALIYFDTDDPEVIVERLLTRSKTIASHKGKSREELKQNIQNWQELLKIITGKLLEKEIPVYRLEGLHSVQQNVQKLKEILTLS
jgi:adenylate kinase family enzyme